MHSCTHLIRMAQRCMAQRKIESFFGPSSIPNLTPKCRKKISESRKILRGACPWTLPSGGSHPPFSPLTLIIFLRPCMTISFCMRGIARQSCTYIYIMNRFEISGQRHFIVILFPESVRENMSFVVAKRI